MTDLNILLVGGTGSIGRHVARVATAAGHSIRILSRQGGAHAVRGDLTDPASLAENMPVSEEPAAVRDDLDRIAPRRG